MTNFLIGTAWTAFVAGVGALAGWLYAMRVIDELNDYAKLDQRVIANLRTECQALIAEKRRRDAPLRAANSRRHAEALERKNQAKARTNALHAELRELTEGLI